MARSSARAFLAALGVLHRRVFFGAVVGAGAALLALLLFFAAPAAAVPRGLLAVLAAIYLARKGMQAYQAQRRIQQLRLEARFLAQSFEAGPFRDALTRRDHLWTASATLHGLQRAHRQPVPHLLSDEEKTRRLRRHYERAFRPLRPGRLAVLDVLPAAALLVLLAGEADAGGAWPLPLGLLVLPFLLLVEAALLALCRRLHRAHGSLLDALALWTLSGGVEAAFRAEQDYDHALLYHAQPHFGAATAAEEADAA